VVSLAEPRVVKGVPRSILGEGPIWDDASRTLYWVDILGGKIHFYRPHEGSSGSIEAGRFVSCVALTASGDIVATVKDRVILLRGGRATTLVEIREPERNRFNDCKCDSAGRLWAGTMDMEEREPIGSLYVIDSSLKVRKALGGVTISNGIAWSRDDRLMYYIDSPRRAVEVYEFYPGEGRIGNMVKKIDLSKYQGIPDGMTIDSQGNLWVAIWGAGRVVSIDPIEGRILGEIRFPAPFASSCTFGGEEMETLYVTTAMNSVKGLPEHGLDGYLFEVRPGAKGVRANRFKI